MWAAASAAMQITLTVPCPGVEPGDLMYLHDVPQQITKVYSDTLLEVEPWRPSFWARFRLMWRKLLVLLLICAPIGWLPYLTGAQPHWYMALFSSLIGPTVGGVVFYLTTRHTLEYRLLAQQTERRLQQGQWDRESEGSHA